MQITFDSTIKITDMITSISVICALCTLTYTWAKDRNLRSKEYADKIRAAAASTLARVDRCQSLLLSLGEIVQPAITEIDGLMIQGRNSVECRDRLWKVLHELRTSIAIQFSEEEIEIAYAPLLAYRKNIYSLLKSALQAARTADSVAFESLQELLQIAVLKTDVDNVQSAELGNILRAVCSIYSNILSEHLNIAFDEVRNFLRRTIEASDRVVLLSDHREPLADLKESVLGVAYWNAQWTIEKGRFGLLGDMADVENFACEPAPVKFEDAVAKLFTTIASRKVVFSDHLCFRPNPLTVDGLTAFEETYLHTKADWRVPMRVPQALCIELPNVPSKRKRL